MRLIFIIVLILFSLFCDAQIQSFLRAGSTVQTNDLEANCLHCWDFEEGSGTTAADDFGGKTLTLVNTPTWITRLNGAGAIRLDAASSEYLYNNTVSDIRFDLDTDDFTVAFWYLGDSVDVDLTYLLGYAGGGYFSSISTVVRFTRSSAPTHVSYDPFTTYQLFCDADWAGGGWHHHVFVYTSSNKTIKSYYKGNYASTQTFSFTSFDPATSSIFRIGNVDGTYITIDVGQVAYWNIALDADQIESLYNNGETLLCSEFN